eukprot:TRINITY_DN7193_c0_g3_i1.p1 TRINITY_DN7193_c0_g3~~TRINITY_DN7193_c0_g3_i1.p1  ORF type:complete len:261 (-),score=59.73 TRINITY_DN7193_c0_g3_i1:30-731(-)
MAGHIALLYLRTQGMFLLVNNLQTAMRVLCVIFFIFAALSLISAFSLIFLDAASASFSIVNILFEVFTNVGGVAMAAIDVMSSIYFVWYVNSTNEHLKSSQQSLIGEARARQTFLIAKKGLIISCISVGAVLEFAVQIFYESVLVQQWFFLAIYVSLVAVGILWMELKILLDRQVAKMEENLNLKNLQTQLGESLEYQPPTPQQAKSGSGRASWSSLDKTDSTKAFCNMQSEL